KIKRPINDLVAKHGRDEPGHVALEYPALDEVALVRDRAAGSPHKRVQPTSDRVRRIVGIVDVGSAYCLVALLEAFFVEKTSSLVQGQHPVAPEHRRVQRLKGIVNSGIEHCPDQALYGIP